MSHTSKCARPTPTLTDRGGFCMMSRSGGLKPRAVAGRPSVTRLTQSSCTGIRASGRPKAAVRKMLRGREGGRGGEDVRVIRYNMLHH